MSEFGKALLDILERECKESAAAWNGQTLARVQCGSCGAASDTSEAFNDLEVALPAPVEVTAATLQSLVDAQLLRTERLEGDNRFYCAQVSLIHV